MNMTEVRGDASSSAKENNVDLKLEVVVIQVSDVDRAKEFYWRLDADFPFDNGCRVVQFTPAGSGSSVQFGSKITSAAPGSAQEYLIVSDVEADQLAARGVEVSEVFYPGTPGAQFQPDDTNARVTGPAPDHASYRSFATFTDPDGNGWLLHEITTRLPGRIDAADNKLSGDRLLVATGSRPRIENLGLETVGVEVNGHGVPVDSRLRVAERVWAVGDITGIWQLTHVGKYQGEVVASKILGEPREANHDAVPRVLFTDPQAAALGATSDRFNGTARLSQLPKTETYTRAYAESKGFLILLSDGQRLTGAYPLGPEAGEWLQQATLAVRARVPIEVLRDTIQPFPTFSEIYVEALKALRAEIATARHPVSVGAR
jgi:catechol 2,3-dioxygenase-like lactoylglutathione lyase family enzyme